MKTHFYKTIMQVQVAVLLTVLTVSAAVAQHASQAMPVSTSSDSQSQKVKIDLFREKSSRAKCDYYLLAQRCWNSEEAGEKFLNTETVKFEHSSAQADPQEPDDAQELAKKLSNPVASLISFPMQSNFDFGMGTGSGWRYTLNVQPVIPIKLSEKWNLISRTIVPIIHQGNVTGPNTSQTGLGDTLQSFFFSPSKTEPLIWAIGPVVLIPTATNDALGSKKWGLGPTALALKQQHGWTYGILANHVWSVAGRESRPDVSSTFLQPFLSYTTRDAWTYSINTESTYDWTSNSWSVPINPFISKLVRFGKQPVSFGAGLRCWATSPSGGPEGCGLRIVVTALFPKK